MLDDDMELTNNKYHAEQYLSLIRKQPNNCFEYQNFLLNMFGIPKRIFEKIDYDDIEAERGEGYEDWIFVTTLHERFPQNFHRINSLNLIKGKRSDFTEDEYSTWITPQVDKEAISAKSSEIISKRRKHYSPKPTSKARPFF